MLLISARQLLFPKTRDRLFGNDQNRFLLVVGLGEACRLASREMAADHARIKQLSDRLVNGITSQIDHIVRNGDPAGYPGCVNLSFAYVEGESLLMALKVRFAA